MGKLTDAALSRRTDWIGAAFYLPAMPTLPDGAGYYRFQGHDYQTGLSIFVFLGKRMPQGEPVYRWSPDTTYYPAIPRTVFKPWWVVLSLTLAVVWTLLNTSFFAGDFAPVFWLLGMLVIAFDFCFRWFYFIEPVRGSKVSAAIVAALSIREATRD